MNSVSRQYIKWATYIFRFLCDKINPNMIKDNLHTSTPCVTVHLASTWKVIHNTLEICFIHRDIHSRLYTKIIFLESVHICSHLEHAKIDLFVTRWALYLNDAISIIAEWKIHLNNYQVNLSAEHALCVVIGTLWLNLARSLNETVVNWRIFHAVEFLLEIQCLLYSLDIRDKYFGSVATCNFIMCMLYKICQKYMIA